MPSEAFEILIHPDAAIRRLKSGSKIGGAFGILLCGWLNFLIALFLLFKREVSLPGFILLFALTGAVLLGLFLMKAAWIHFFAELLGIRGRLPNLVSMMGYSSAPFGLFLPSVLIAQGTSPFLVFPSGLGILAWTAVLGFKSLKANYGISTGKAALLGAAPAFFLFSMTLLPAAVLLGMFLTGLASVFLAPLRF
jgi:hypothetical protein